jgi:hypothetical protein
MAAIERALEDIVNSSSNIEELSLKCLVLGPGLGRLVRFCIEAARQCNASVSVHVLEANPVAVEFVRKSFAKEIDDKVCVCLLQPLLTPPPSVVQVYANPSPSPPLPSPYNTGVGIQTKSNLIM